MSGQEKTKKEIVKEIISGLHQGLSVQEARERFEKEVGGVSSTEIAAIEQSLLDEGLPPEEIKKFCNVHALLFQSALEKSVVQEESPAHPLYLFKLENREIEKMTGALKNLGAQAGEGDISGTRQEMEKLLNRLRDIEVHYTRKEQLLFPYLEKYGFYGPSKVMWGKDNEVRDLLKKSLASLERVSSREEMERSIRDDLNPFLEEAEGMIFKEEKILFPASLGKLNLNDWVEILKESDEVGYVFIETPRETGEMIRELKGAVIEEPTAAENRVKLPTGELSTKELMAALNTLPVEITFIDADDQLRYFSDNKGRTFVRTKSAIGRKVQNCHPPQSVDKVEEILRSFKEGRRDAADFWIQFKGRFISIRFFALRDPEGKYLGTMEITQDITELKKLEGEKRLLELQT